MFQKYERVNGHNYIVYELEQGDTVNSLDFLCACGCGGKPFILHSEKKKLLKNVMAKSDKTLGVFMTNHGWKE